MANREELEIQDWQREPGLKNPLTPEQVAYLVEAEKTLPFAMGDPQEVAEWLLAKNPEASFGQLIGVVFA
jgi:hypothetical protein